jgi:hypothetical protein
MADRAPKLLSKNRLDDWSIVGCIRLSCLNFWTKVSLPEVFEITSSPAGEDSAWPRNGEQDSDFLDNDQYFLDNRGGDLCFGIQ